MLLIAETQHPPFVVAAASLADSKKTNKLGRNSNSNSTKRESAVLGLAARPAGGDGRYGAAASTVFWDDAPAVAEPAADLGAALCRD